MPAIADIIIRRPPAKVWSVIADASTHVRWLGGDGVTTYDGELADGMKFRRVENETGLAIEGEVVAVTPEQFLKVRVDAAPDAFMTTEYHLVAIADGCAVRVLCEAYDTGETRHMYMPEMMEQEWQKNLKRLRSYCEAGQPPQDSKRPGCV